MLTLMLIGLSLCEERPEACIRDTGELADIQGTVPTLANRLLLGAT